MSLGPSSFHSSETKFKIRNNETTLRNAPDIILGRVSKKVFRNRKKKKKGALFSNTRVYPIISRRTNRIHYLFLFNRGVA